MKYDKITAKNIELPLQLSVTLEVLSEDIYFRIYQDVYPGCNIVSIT